jgi:hypothetical protein
MSLPAKQTQGQQGKGLIPLDVIRTETVLSRLPVHNLAKKGRIEIQIVRKSDRGESGLKWIVSYNERSGQARQLAYKIDTLIVNRRIDELGRPLPKYIRLGSLREIARELGIRAEDTDSVKRAIKQNAGIQVEAELTYKGRDGKQRELEAIFHRYSVVFTGEKLDGGQRANAVYLALDPVYQEVLNHAPDRPLNYTYLVSLTPAAQRFYELISYYLFTTIKYGHPYAQILYSEYCTFSAQERHFDKDKFKSQMYKIHRPHLRSGYLKKASYESTLDRDGKTDWILYYTPGPRAKKEYRAFNPEKRADKLRITESNGDPKGEETDDQVVGGSQADEVVRLFYQLFHNAEVAYPRAKELAQAQTLIDKHGAERARHIVEYAHRAAAETKYQPQTFSGILHYVTPALASFEETQKSKQAKAAIAGCKECDDGGWIHFRDANGYDFNAYCPHDAAMIEARITREQLTRIPPP